MNNGTVSVIIPTWNSASTLAAAIQGCLKQTVPILEILVCDDGSTDTSRAIVEGITDSRVRWIEGAHSGIPAVPRNRGLAEARGEWVALCDSDDEWLPKKTEKQMAMLKKTGHGISCSNALRKVDGIITTDMVSKWSRESLSFNTLLKGNIVVCSSVVMKRSLYATLGGFPEEREYASFEDYIYWLRVATKTDFAFVPEGLVIYDDHPATSIRSTFLSGELLRIKTLNNFIAWTRRQGLYSYLVRAKVALLKDAAKKIIRSKMRP